MQFRYSILLLALFLLSCYTVQGQQQPNILWLITDDQRADALECYNLATTGQNNSPLGHVESPNIDAIAREGVLFTRGYCNSPACAPSRTSMHTGQYPHHNGEYDFTQTHPEPDFVRPLVPEILRSNGYRTAHFGKSGVYRFGWGPGQTYNRLPFYDLIIDHQGELARHGYGDWSRSGDDETFWFPNGTSYALSRARSVDMTEAQLQARAEFDPRYDILRSYTRWNDALIIGGVSTMPASETTDAYILKEFINYLQNANRSYHTYAGTNTTGADTTRPLMIHLGFHLPHTPVLPPASFRERFKDKVYNIPEFDKAELDLLPAQLKKIYDQMKIDALTYDEKQQMIRDYYAFCAFGDSLIGKAVEEFKAYSEARDQEYLVIIATGDHGWHLGEQGISAKFAPWDYSNHTGVIVVSSDKEKFPAGIINDDPVEYVDFAPTMFAAAGIDVDDPGYDYLDGYDLARVVDSSLAPRAYVLGELKSVCGPRAYLRSAGFAFSMRVRPNNAPTSPSNPPNNNIRWGLESSDQSVEMALYDLRIDPKERTNVAYSSDYYQLARWFRQKLGNIVLGDGRVECSWSEENNYSISNFAPGADDKLLEIPPEIIPSVDDFEEASFSVYKKKARSVTPLEGARIGISPMALYTDSLGQAAARLAAGSYQYTVTAPGVTSEERTIGVAAGSTSFSDTLDVEYYFLELAFTHEISGAPVEGVRVTLGDSVLLSDQGGMVRYDSLLYDTYSIVIEDPRFEPMDDLHVLLDKSTDLLIELKPRAYDQRISVLNAWNGDPVKWASVSFGGETILCDHNGEAVIRLIPGFYDLTISETRYQDSTVNVMVENDESHVFYLKQKLADATFRVRYNGAGLAGVNITIAGDTLETSAAGIASAEDLLTDSAYSLMASKELYAAVHSTLVVYADTIVVIHMQTATSSIAARNDQIRIYPNPTSGLLHLEGIVAPEKFLITDAGGRVLYTTQSGDRATDIDLGHLGPGVYLLKLSSSGSVYRIMLL